MTFLFLLFTWSLLLAHLRYLLLNLTTVEEHIIQRVTRPEAEALADAYGPLALRKHREVRKQWDKDWGDPWTEGNPFWLGSYRANFEMVCGKNKLAWFRAFPFSLIERTD
jgi:palmitoyltransferase